MYEHGMLCKCMSAYCVCMLYMYVGIICVTNDVIDMLQIVVLLKFDTSYTL